MRESISPYIFLQSIFYSASNLDFLLVITFIHLKSKITINGAAYEYPEQVIIRQRQSA
jgi:hypothetical protein